MSVPQPTDSVPQPIDYAVRHSTKTPSKGIPYWGQDFAVSHIGPRIDCHMLVDGHGSLGDQYALGACDFGIRF